MEIHIFPDKARLGKAAARSAANLLLKAISARDEANLILATGVSQFEMLTELLTHPIDWSKVTVFHLDEYIGLPIEHPASFRKYLRERFVAQVPGLRQFHEINGEADPQSECERLNRLIAAHPIDVACVGIGENGHLAFNDPPADFETIQPYLVVNLDEACRRQQLGEGWFPTLEDVPRQAISMGIQQIMSSRAIICSVPDERKAKAVQGTVDGTVTPAVPASILQNHPDCHLFLDEASAQLLERA